MQRIMTVPTVASPRDGTSNSYSIAPTPDNTDENNIGYCNILPPAPRSQLTNYPPKSTMCSKPYQKDSCYLVNNADQGVVGLVCNNAGGSDNSNSARGNEFSNDFYWAHDQKINEYTIERPVQVPLEQSNPTLIYQSSNFYPNTNRDNREKYPWYRSYPHFKNYSANGLPIYTYPYPIPKKEIIEGFTNVNKKLTKIDYLNLGIMIIIVVALIFAITYFL